MEQASPLIADCQCRTDDQRIAFRKGERIGCLEVLEDVPRGRMDRDPVQVRCVNSGVEYEIMFRSLHQRRRCGGKHCKSCQVNDAGVEVGISEQGLERPHKPPTKICPVCYGLPHRRPQCGCWSCEKPYAAEVVSIDLNDRHPGNMALGMSRTLNAFDAFERSPQHRGKRAS
jgi:hypothetical protein